MAGRTGAVSAGVALHAFNEIAIAPVLPAALAELGGVRFLPWVYSLFFVGVIAGGMTAAALRGRFGARRAMMFAAGLYLSGLLAGVLTPGISPLLGGRLVQGVADGWIVALCYSLIPDLFPARLMARVFAIEAMVWAAAAVLGPVASGLAAEAFGWRAAMAVSLPLLIMLGLVVKKAVPDEARLAKTGQIAANAGLVMVCLFAALLFSVPSVLPAQPLAILLLPVSAVILVLVFRTDRARRERFFPAQIFGLGSSVGRGSWMLLLMSAAQSVSTVFLAFALRGIFELPPVWTGLIMVTMALSWSVVAIPVGSLSGFAVRCLLLRLGPAFQVLGVVLIATGLSLTSLPLVIGGQLLVGTGFGMAWAITTQAIMEHAAPTERTGTSAILPAISTSGYVIGAGLGGSIATISGLFEAMEQKAAAVPVLFLWGSAAGLACLAVIAVQGLRPAQTPSLP
jgi:MFS family permease